MTTGVHSLREFKMPDVGEGLTEAEILTWYVKPGDAVTDGQVVCEVETAKAAVELPIPFTGVVEALHFPAGATVDVGTPIIAVAVAGAAPAAAAPAAAAPVVPAPATAAEAEPEPERREVLVGYGPRTGSAQRRTRRSNGTAAPTAPAPAPVAPAAPAPEPVAVAPVAPAAPVVEGERPLAKPPVRKLAKDLGIDLRAVVPTGPNGVITREDVHAAANTAAGTAVEPVAVQAAPAAQPTAPAVAAPVRPVPDASGDVRVPVKGVRKATAQAMVASAFTAPHVTEFVQVDVTRTMKLVRRLKESGELGAGVRVSPLLLVAKALLTAVKRYPEVNASWDEAAQEIVIRGAVNLGIAAATPRGLIVPNIKDAGSRTLSQLAVALGELVETARQGKTSPADMAGGSITITNVGVFGVDTGTPILNPGEAAILAFGAVRELPWVHKGKVVPRQVTTLALSFDHRLVDGELGSKVLADVAAVLEHPKRLITWG
ncbi:dihydrolipoamide acetyltransferase family protein [Kitasatospora sp. NPDC090308]|uniref:dihydrolipoamide acetyltransferase family protein n=1 Tax=Kitasatospora sp. NPDC090308 TaxID=3364082 RepID=UPI0037F401C7